MRISDWSSDVCSSDLKMISVAEFHGDAAVDVPLGAHQRRAEEELDPARPVDVDEFRRQLGIIAAQDRVRTVQEGHLAAKTVEDAGELDRDIAASNDHDDARQGLEFEYLLRRDSMRDAVNIRN